MDGFEGRALMMGCREVGELLSGLLDEMLTPSERAAVEAHVASCAACDRELGELRRIVAALNALPPVAAPAELRRRIAASIRSDRDAAPLAKVLRWAFPEPQGRMLLAAAAMTGLAALVGYGVFVFGPSGPARDRAKSNAVAPAEPAAQATVPSTAEAVRSERRSSPPEALAPPPAPGAASSRDFAPVPELASRALSAAPEAEADAKAVDKVAPPADQPEGVSALGYLGASEESKKGKLQRDEDARQAMPELRQNAEREAVVTVTGEKRLRASAEPASAPALPPPPAAPSPSVEQQGVPRAESMDDGVLGGVAGETGKGDVAAKAAKQEEGFGAGAVANGASGAEHGAATEDRLRFAPEPVRSPPAKEKAPQPSAPARTAEDRREAARPAEIPDAEGGRQKERAKDDAAHRALLLVDEATGWFRRDHPAADTRGRRDGGLFASLELLSAADASGPLMRLSFPTDGWKERLSKDPSMGPAGGSLGSTEAAPLADKGLDVGIEVRGRRCSPEDPGAPGSDRAPLLVGDDVATPVLLEGQAPAITPTLAGSLAVYEVTVLRDGSVGHVAVAPGGDLPSGRNPDVIWALYRWRFTPGSCDGQPVATRFRLQVSWFRERRR